MENFMQRWIPSNYIKHITDQRRREDNIIRHLLEQGRMPIHGWTDKLIERFLGELAAMDSNNFESNVGLGERESRIHSDLVARRHFRLGHGMGRSGNLTGIQPKAIGSSLIWQLTTSMVRHALIISGADRNWVEGCIVLPLATGMALTMALLTLKSESSGNYVILPRIDQKTCVKCIYAAGLEPVIIEELFAGDELTTNLDLLESTIVQLGGSHSILAIVSVTSCFCPRAPDDVVQIGKLCKNYTIPHIVNNAYGIHSEMAMKALSRCSKSGRVDLVVQSMDKNFMVPVGGSIIVGPSIDLIDSIASLYPGRASMSPIMDLFITLLSMGEEGLRQLQRERQLHFELLKGRLIECGKKNFFRVLDTPHNDISIAISLDKLQNQCTDLDMNFVGSMLFTRCVSGTRVYSPRTAKPCKIGKLEFSKYGAHHDLYPIAYISCASALGITRNEIDEFIERLESCITSLIKKNQHDL